MRSRGFFDVGAGCFQASDVGHDQLVGISLFLRERRSGLDALGGVGNRAIKRSPSCSKAERRDHQARVAKDSLRLIESLTFDAADEPVSRDIDIVEGERGRVAEANAVLVFGLVVGETLRVFLHDEPAWTARRVGQNRVGTGDAAVADPLFGCH